MYPDDRVLVGVINRKKDLKHLLESQWYRIPQPQLEDGVYVEYLAFYLSGSAAKQFEMSGIHYFAARQGVELRYRRELLPDEPQNPRADNAYYKIQVSNIEQRRPPITNPTKRPISFIITTWDRFVNASVIADLYSQGDYFVDRIYHALRDRRIRPKRYWDAQRKRQGLGAAIRILCEKGTLTAHTDSDYREPDSMYLDPELTEDQILEEIRAQIAHMGGAVTLPIPPIR